MLCFYIDGFLFPWDTFQLFSWLLLSLFGFAHSLSSVCVMFCRSSCVSVAHLAPCTREKTKADASSSNKDRVAVERFCTKCPYRTLLQRFRETHSEEIAEGSLTILLNKCLVLSKIMIHTGAQRIWLLHNTKALWLQEKQYILYRRKYMMTKRVK